MSIPVLIPHVGGAFVSVDIQLYFFITVTHKHNLAGAVKDAVIVIVLAVRLGIDHLDFPPRMAVVAECDVGPDR